MSKWLITLLVVVLAGAGVYFWIGRDNTSNAEASTIRSSLQDLALLGRSQQCSFNTIDGPYLLSGTVQTMEGKIRAQYTIYGLGSRQNWELLQESGRSYIWPSGGSTGWETSTQALALESTSTPSEGNIFALQSIPFDCRQEEFPSSDFTPPATVTFGSTIDALEPVRSDRCAAVTDPSFSEFCQNFTP